MVRDGEGGRRGMKGGERRRWRRRDGRRGVPHDFTDLTECRCRGAGVKAMRVCEELKYQLIVNLN